MSKDLHEIAPPVRENGVDARGKRRETTRH